MTYHLFILIQVGEGGYRTYGVRVNNCFLFIYIGLALSPFGRGRVDISHVSIVSSSAWRLAGILSRCSQLFVIGALA